jgi:hypothetical protein
VGPRAGLDTEIRGQVYRVQSVKIKTKRERMNRGCNTSLNVFKPTPPLYCNSGVCHKSGPASYLWITYWVQYSKNSVFFNFAD